MALSRLVTLSISSLRNLDIGANKFYDRAHRLYDAAHLTRSYTQHALQSYTEMIGKYHNHTPKTNPRDREEEQQNIYSNNTSVR